MDITEVSYDTQYSIYQEWYKTYESSRYNLNIWHWESRSHYDCMLDFLSESNRPFIVKMDGLVMKYTKTHNDAFGYILKNQSQSVSWATKHWWWEIVEA